MMQSKTQNQPVSRTHRDTASGIHTINWLNPRVHSGSASPGVRSIPLSGSHFYFYSLKAGHMISFFFKGLLSGNYVLLPVPHPAVFMSSCTPVLCIAVSVRLA